MTRFTVDPEKHITAAARLLAEAGIQCPAWAHFVKTGVNRERVPEQDNWWEIRGAGLLRKLFYGETIGVQKLRKAYGGRKNRGHKPERVYPASGAIIRRLLQQLEEKGFVAVEKGKGRIITSQGRKLLREAEKKAI